MNAALILLTFLSLAAADASPGPVPPGAPQAARPVLAAVTHIAARTDPSPGVRLAEASKPTVLKVMVLEPSVVNDDDKNIATVVGSLLPIELAEVKALEVLSVADVKQMVELEAEKEAMGCSDNSCLAELAGALGADLVVFGDVSRLGQLIIVNLNLFDSVKARAAGRVSIQTKDVESLPGELKAAVRKLVRPFLETKQLPIPSSWDQPDAAPAPTAAAAPSPEAQPTQPTGVGGATEPADGGVIFALLPWAVGAAGGAIGVLGVLVATVGAVIPLIGVPAVLSTAATTQDKQLYELLGHTYVGLHIMFYGGLATGAMLLLGGGLLATAGVGWGVLGFME